MQTDTLLAIGTTEYFPNYPGFAGDWFLLGQGTDFRRVLTGQPSTQGTLRWMIQQCKDLNVGVKDK